VRAGIREDAGVKPARGSRALRLRLHVHLGDEHSLGPGKVQLLETVRELGSITAAARAMGMAYRHAWDLIDDLERCFRRPVVETASGGRAGGGARLTPFGGEVIRRFRAMERAANTAMARELRALEAELRPARPAPRRRRPRG
jgi:molybdate transport system regulatory protein